MAKETKKAKGAADWDAPENEAQNNFLKWGEPGDKILGALVSRKQVESTLPDRKGEMQWVYEFKVIEGEYHNIVDGEVDEEATVLEKGEIVNVGGRPFYDSRMARAQIGQIVGLKYIEDLKPKTKGYNPTKVIKVYFPKEDDGEYQFDAEVLNAHNVAEFDKKNEDDD
jgi:hypothetical protein